MSSKEQMRQYMRTYSKRLRERVLALLGGKCTKCPVTDPRLLQIDHIAGGGSKDRKYDRNALYRKVLKDTTGFQLLCANCNWLKRYENNEVPCFT